MHLAVFAPAFTFSLGRKLSSRKPQVRIASFVRLRKNLRFAFQKPCLIMYENKHKFYCFFIAFFLPFFLHISLKMFIFMQLNKNTALCTTLKANPAIKCRYSVWIKW